MRRRGVSEAQRRKAAQTSSRGQLFSVTSGEIRAFSALLLTSSGVNMFIQTQRGRNTKLKAGQVKWLTSVIPAAQEAESRIASEASSGQIVPKTLS
jgi:hypothetical protein